MVETMTMITTTQRGEGENTRRLWLVRHGLTAWNTQQRFCGHSHIPLSVRGQAQARWLARQLQHEAIAIIHTSDLVRERKTAEVIPGSLSAIDLLPTGDPQAPQAILALLNAQSSTRAGQSANGRFSTRAPRGTKAEAAPVGTREEGTS